MRPYQKGDVVTCIKERVSTPKLTIGKDYTVSRGYFTSILYLTELENGTFSVMAERFRPKHWCVKQTDDPRWQRVIDYLNHLRGCKWLDGLSRTAYYGFDGVGCTAGVMCSSNFTEFENNAIELTLDEWINFRYDKDIYKEQSTSQPMEQVTLTRKQLIEIYHRISCGAVRSVIESYLDNYRLGFDDTPCVIKQTDLDRIKELNSEQRRIVGEYIKLPEEKTYVQGQCFISGSGAIYMLCQVNASKACLICMNGDTGNRKSDPITIKGIMNVTQREIDQMSGAGLTPIEVTITKKS